MCLACEEQEYFFRLWCVDFLARGEMPPGVTMEDLEALGLPPPKPAAGDTGAEPVKRPVGAALASEASGQRGDSIVRAPDTRPVSGSSARAANAFACDSPDE
jgi:hypothetical protein